MSVENQKLVTCTIIGGLGNQLFQIFTTIAYGIETKRKIVFSDTDFLTVGTVRSTYWNNFLNGLKIFTDKKYDSTPQTLLRNKYNFFSEKEFSYNEIPFFPSFQKLCIVGYYQSYKYFDNVKDKLFQMIRLRNQKMAIVTEFSHFLLNESNNISMHFRLGDYKHIQDCHPLIPYEYYENAVGYIVNKRSEKRHQILYFCQVEDNEVVSEMISKLSIKYTQISFIKVDDAIPDWKQLLIMSCCHDNIIANSTFSWWGAYFNETPEKIVCYPDKWFGPELQHDVRDLFIDSWTKIPCSEQ
jgi:hypothetical protein